MARARDAGYEARDVVYEVTAAARSAPDGRRAVFDEHAVAGVLSLTPSGGAHRRDVVTAFARGAGAGTPAPDLGRVVSLWVPPDGVGVAEPLHRRQAALPGGHVLRALGPRPVRPAEHEVWVGAARAVDAYRARWGLTRSPDALGTDALSTMAVDRLADHVRTARLVDEARTRLVWRPERSVELARGR
jgi:hypothetical protein